MFLDVSRCYNRNYVYIYTYIYIQSSLRNFFLVFWYGIIYSPAKNLFFFGRVSKIGTDIFWWSQLPSSKLTVSYWKWIENGLYNLLIYLFKMMIFRSFVGLPEGNRCSYS